MPKQSILCEKIFSQNLMQISALLQVKAENGKTSCFIILPISVHMWHLIFFWHARYFPVFWRPQENLGQYPFHSPSSCLQQKITLLFLVDIFRTTVKHLISSLHSTWNIPKHIFGTKYVPKILLFHQLSIFTSKQEKQHHPSVPQFSFTHDHLSTQSGLIKDRLQPLLLKKNFTT